jgi:hypothetical protein
MEAQIEALRAGFRAEAEEMKHAAAFDIPVLNEIAARSRAHGRQPSRRRSK